MTKIRSRPGSTIAGSGPYTLKMEFEELQLIAAFLHVTRLGHGSVYKGSAYKLMCTLEGMFDVDFTTESAADVDMAISVLEDYSDTAVAQFPYTNVCVEV